MTATAQNILKTLVYFDLFQYPLTQDEICLFHADIISHAAIDEALQELVNEKSVFRLGEFYSLRNDFLLVQRRRKGNLLAMEQMKTAGRVAKFLAKFPYVKAVAVSGSLSKNFATEKSDIDFFIITTANRLWIARTCMHLYKKLTFLTGRQNWFCMNYFVDEVAMEIEEKNIFTAIEIVTLVPMQGKSSFLEFVMRNKWTKDYFPLHIYNNSMLPEIHKGLLARAVEKIFCGKPGDWLDKKLMRITKKRWQKKVEKHMLNSRGGAMGMIVERHCSKPDPKNFQDKVVEKYGDKVKLVVQQKDVPVSVIV
ncbi:MAG: nucleotidyltransferase domain-containing protein [Ferruginibacter sp.]